MTAPAAVVVASNVGRKAAATAGGLISEALTADLAIIRYQYQPHAKRKKKKGNPVDLELHVNPAAIGVGVLGVGAALWLMQMRVAPEKKTRYYGKWYFQGFDPASGTLWEDRKGRPPTRVVPVDYERRKGRGYGGEVTKTETQTAYWQREGSEVVKAYGLQERQGYNGGPVSVLTDVGATILDPFGWFR